MLWSMEALRAADYRGMLEFLEAAGR